MVYRAVFNSALPISFKLHQHYKLISLFVCLFHYIVPRPRLCVVVQRLGGLLAGSLVTLHPRTPVDFFYQLVALKREIEEKA
jgi:hypothetical protein